MVKYMAIEDPKIVNMGSVLNVVLMRNLAMGLQNLFKKARYLMNTIP